MMVPHFPPTADMSLHVDHGRVENISVGRMNVVELGPKFAKKRINAYVTVKPACIPGLD